MNTFHTRRKLLRWSAAAPLAWISTLLLPARALAAWPQALFSSPTSRDAIDSLQAGAAEPGKRILLEVPEITDRGDIVLVRVMSTLPATEQITLLVDKALRPVVAQFNFTTDAEPDVTVSIKLPGTSTIRAVVKAGGKLYVVSKEVKLAAEPYVPADQSGKTKKGS